MEQQTTHFATAAGSVVCPQCNLPLPYYDIARSVFFGCYSCHAYFTRDAGSSFTMLRQRASSPVYPFTLPLGATHVMQDKAFTVVGQIQKRDKSDHDMVWNEYLLCCEGVDDYYTLAETNGDWLLVWAEQLTDHEVRNIGTEQSPVYEVFQLSTGKIYTHYTTYFYDILAACGEFDWDVRAEAGAKQVSEYTSIDEVIVSEQLGGNTSWFVGKSVDRMEINRVFSVSMETLLSLRQFDEEEEPWYVATWPVVLKFTLLASIVLLLAVWVVSSIKPTKEVFNEQFVVQKDTAKSSWSETTTIVTQPFEIRSSGAVGVIFSSPISNDWLELSVQMVNEKTGKVYEFTKAIEYYSGYEGSEFWSEGSREETSVLSSVPAGLYHLNVLPYSELPYPVDLTIKVEQNTSTSNIVLTFFVLLSWPFIQFLLVVSYQNSKSY